MMELVPCSAVTPHGRLKCISTHMMYIFQLKAVDNLTSLIFEHLRSLGVKHGLKKLPASKYRQDKPLNVGTKIFKVPLGYLGTEPAVLNSGTPIDLPAFFVEACYCIQQNIDTEGLFRKAGSSARQREIKALLDRGSGLRPDFNVIDVANILKLFFRELPEPLIPFICHDIFLRCLLLKDKKVQSILMTCLLIPLTHLQTLAYLMEFLQQVASHSNSNKMDATNLAIIITPSIMPVGEKVGINTGVRLSLHVQVVEILIQNAEKIGAVPDSISDKVCASRMSPCEELDRNDTVSLPQSKKKKKKRSSSLTRMISGLKKMVGKGSPGSDEENHAVMSTPDFSTPCVKSAKKRKVLEANMGFSSKKKRDVLEALPAQVTLASLPFTPVVGYPHSLTPQVCTNPNPTRKSKTPPKSKHRILFTPKHINNNVLQSSATKGDAKKMRLRLVRGRSSKKQKDETSLPHQIATTTSCTSLEGRWSSGMWRRSKRLNMSDVLAAVDMSEENGSYNVSEGNLCVEDAGGVNLSDLEGSMASSEDFVRIPKSEYEAIKIRVSAIESRISQEFDNMGRADLSSEKVTTSDLVQSAYEKTLEQSERLCDTSAPEQLARRLGRELKIRRSLENKIIRSPSARKIGTIRRRSRERTSGLARHASWHLPLEGNTSSLRRGRPNTVQTGLPARARRACSFNGHPCSDGHQHMIRKSTSHGHIEKLPQHTREAAQWQCAEQVIEKRGAAMPVTGRASVDFLRSQNAGLVHARMKLFDAKSDRKLVRVLNEEQSKRQQRAVSKQPHSVQGPSVSCKKHRVRAGVSPGASVDRSTKRLCSAKCSDSLTTREVGKENVQSPCNAVMNAAAVAQNEYTNNKSSETPVKFSPQIVLPQNLKDTIYDVCTPILEKIHRASVSPLKDSNRIGPGDSHNIPFVKVTPNSSICPKRQRDIPHIKNPLLTKSQGQVLKTPLTSSRSCRTPVRALPGYAGFETPAKSPRKSPRLLKTSSANLKSCKKDWKTC